MYSTQRSALAKHLRPGTTRRVAPGRAASLWACASWRRGCSRHAASGGGGQAGAQGASRAVHAVDQLRAGRAGQAAGQARARPHARPKAALRKAADCEPILYTP